MSNLEKGCSWHFAEQTGGSDEGPNNAMQDNFKKIPYDSLIRESIQNSLDVVSDEAQPVRMEYTIGRLPVGDYRKLLDLREHINGCLEYYNENENAQELFGAMLERIDNMGDYMSYIKVSDYNTKGMDYVEGNTSNPFYSFVRAKGVSTKSEASSGGSYGYGKGAFYNISPLQTILVSTRTAQGKCFFEGVSVLCTHTVDGKKLVATGYYDNNNGNPISDIEDIPDEFRRGEPGTDIYILGVTDDAVTVQNEAIKATLRNFWMAIENGRLEVVIDNIYEVTKRNLPSLMEDEFPDYSEKSGKIDKYNPRPYWEAVHLADSDKRHRKFERQMPLLGLVKLYVLLDKNAPDNIVYMRKPMMLVYAKKEQSQNGFYAAFLCEDPDGNEYLKKMENPAHNEWSSRNWKYRGTGKNDPRGSQVKKEISDFIKSMKEELFAGNQRDIQDIAGLQDLLYIPDAIEEDDDDFEENLTAGHPKGQKDEEGSSPTTDITADTATQMQNANPDSVGKVMVATNADSQYQNNDDGKYLGGHGKGKRPKTKGGGLGSNNISDRYDKAFEGLDGNTYIELPVKYRSFAVSDKGQTVHVLVIHSEFEADNCRIDLKVGGEQSDDKIAISSCSAGTVKDNRIQNVKLLKGKNELLIRFVDNMRHAVILTAYETK